MSSSFRAKVKRAFSRQRQRDRGSDTSDDRKSQKHNGDWPENVYRPGEAMPKPKYGGPPTKAHQAQLSAFSFDDAWTRRASEQSQYSPRGSRMSSSVGSFRRRSFMLGGGPSRRSSAVEGRLEEDGERDDARNGRTSHPPPLATWSESTQQPSPPPGESIALPRPPFAPVSALSAATSTDTSTNTHPGQSEMDMPFSAMELSRALTRTTID